MRKLILTLIIVLCGLSTYAQTNPGEKYALKVAQRMKDSLQLSPRQLDQIYRINRQLHQQKMAMRQQYFNPDSLTARIQKIENKRDNLYKGVMNKEKYAMYRQKKRTLVNN
jgi:hypothetical protein